ATTITSSGLLVSVGGLSVKGDAGERHAASAAVVEGLAVLQQPPAGRGYGVKHRVCGRQPADPPAVAALGRRAGHAQRGRSPLPFTDHPHHRPPPVPPTPTPLTTRRRHTDPGPAVRAPHPADIHHAWAARPLDRPESLDELAYLRIVDRINTVQHEVVKRA